ncbi:MAG: SIMPL domain-containing protein [Sphingomonadales bacterium]|nr:SIMPL domain-containing protein [Sphingomonadales bacterium]
MKHVAFALALAASSLPGAAMAAELSSGPVVAPGSAVLTVSAEGRTARKPDLALFTAGVTTSGRTAGEALAANSAQMAKVIAALKRAGIADRDVQTSNLSLNPVYADMSRQPVSPLEQQVPQVIGYQVTNQVSVRQRDLEQFGKVIDTLVASGANQVNGPSFQVDDTEAALDDARNDAMKRARERANLYARAAGLKVLRILTIAEAGGYAPPMPVMYARAAMADAGAPAPVAAGEVALQANVTVTFELGQ